MNAADVAFYALVGLAVSTGFLLSLFVGFLVIAGFSKLRSRSSGSAIVRNVGERMGTRATYLPPGARSGPTDQLRTPELLEQSDAKS